MARSDVTVVDTATALDASDEGTVAVAGSHGNTYAGYCAAKAGVRGVVLNDAGVGRDRAGIGSLDYLDDVGLAAVTIDHASARIGDGWDTLCRGVVSYVNRTAADAGCAPGDSVAAATDAMKTASPPETTPDNDAGRHDLGRSDARPSIVGLDSLSMLRDDDEGDVVVTGSHGGRLPAEVERGSYVSVRVAGAVFNDAGVGADRAGVGRLSALADRDVPAFTVDAYTATIGDARSTWGDGRVSYVNAPARERGVERGEDCRTAVDRVAGAADDRGSVE